MGPQCSPCTQNHCPKLSPPISLPMRLPAHAYTLPKATCMRSSMLGCLNKPLTIPLLLRKVAPHSYSLGNSMRPKHAEPHRTICKILERDKRICFTRDQCTSPTIGYSVERTVAWVDCTKDAWLDQIGRRRSSAAAEQLQDCLTSARLPPFVGRPEQAGRESLGCSRL